MSSRILDPALVHCEPLPWRRTSSSGNSDRAVVERPAQVEDGSDVARRVEEARRQGFAEGETRARQAAAQQIQTAIERLARSASEMAGLGAQVRREAEGDLVKLAVAIARRILRRELSVDPEALLGVVKAALDKVDARDLQRIRASADTAPLLARRLNEMGLPQRVEVHADPSLEPGAAILETTRGALDASVNTQLLEIERGLTDALGASK